MTSSHSKTIYILLAIVAMLLLIGIVNVEVETPRERNRRMRAAAELSETKAIARACISRWRLNSDYTMKLREVEQWVETIRQYKGRHNDVVFYCAMIDVESGGNPTAYVESTDARGLGCVTTAAADDVVARNQIMVVKYTDRALFDPHFNLFCMTKLIGQLRSKADEDDKNRYALMSYWMGEAAYLKARGEGAVDYSYYAKVMNRAKVINRLMKGDQR